MGTTAFNFQIRVVACDRCGAPVAVGEAGGAQACAFCGNAQGAAQSSRAVPRSAPMPDAERIERLRAQDRQPIEAPEAIADLFVGVGLLPWKISEALGRWQALRGQLRDAGDPTAEALLHRLTLGLAEHFADEDDAMRERALLEAALDVTTATKFRQSLLGALVRSACRLDDAAAAEAWIALCDPGSDDLMTDTAYRFARATLDTRQQRWDRVLEVLGTRDEVPIDNEHDPACAVLRANALEKLGRGGEAADALDHFYAHTPSFMRYLASRFRTEYESWDLCPASGEEADRRQAARGVKVAGKAAGAAVFAGSIAVAMLVITGLLAVLLGKFVSIGAAHMAVGICGLLLAAFVPLAIYETAKTIRARSLRKHGVAEVGRVVHARFAGQVTMGVPQLLYKITVLPRSGHPFSVHSMFHADAKDRSRFGPGALVVVRMDPDRRDEVQLELD